VNQMESGSFAESIAGAGGLVLAILGIVGVLPVVLGSIAAMSVGVGLFIGSGTIAARSRQLDRVVAGRAERAELLGGLGMEALAGLGGAVLGLLALLGAAPVTLLAVAAIVLGGALLMASGATSRLEASLRRLDRNREASAHEAVFASSGNDFLVGAAAVVLGILALSGFAPLTLSLVAMLSVGTATMMSGSTLAARIFALFGA